MSDLVFEIGTEEIPARFIPGALQNIERSFKELCAAQLLEPARVATVGAPRRLALLAWGLAERQPDRVEERTGPPRRAAVDQDGAYTKAALGFARGQGVAPEELFFKQTDKGEVVAVKKAIPGRPTKQVLAEVLGSIVNGLQFPKSMRWGDLDVRFARPVHWILACLGAAVIDLEFGDVRSSDCTRGHRFESPQPIKVSGPDDYLQQLAARGVIVDPAARQELIGRQVAELARQAGGAVVADEALFEEVTFITESPHAVLGQFDPAYLELPAEVLITPMRQHQKYFALRGPDGRLLPAFVAVANLNHGDDKIIAGGNERVLKARLEDARFFFEDDLKIPLEQRLERLAGVVFQERLGTYLDKVRRVEAVARQLAARLAPDKQQSTARAARLCKTDLVTLMVGEFPELQGTMGTIYALRQGEPEPVARAIAGHYMPRSAGEELLDLPDEAYLVSLADRADTICGCFAAGLKPSGAGDPYMLRRHAIAVMTIIQRARYDLRLDDLLALAAAELQGVVPIDQNLLDEMLEFFRDRLYYQWTNAGGRPDMAEAVLASGCADLLDAEARYRALTRFAARPDFEPVAVAFKRVANILKQIDDGPIDLALFEHDAERGLLTAFETLRSAVAADLAAGRYLEALGRLVELKEPIDRFFDDVMVLCDNPDVRRNRIRLLSGLAGVFRRLADFKKLSV